MIERGLQMAVRVSALMLAVGLVVWLLGVPQAVLLLNSGLWLLIAVPIARVMTALASWVKEGDWLFAALTLFVLSCLLVPLARFVMSYR